MRRDNACRRQRLYILAGGICLKCHKPLGTDYQRHHGGAHDTDGNNAKFPLYTQSMIGWLPLHHACHEIDPSQGKIPEAQVILWERFLQTFVDLVRAGATIPFHLMTEEFNFLHRENKSV